MCEGPSCVRVVCLPPFSFKCFDLSIIRAAGPSCQMAAMASSSSSSEDEAEPSGGPQARSVASTNPGVVRICFVTRKGRVCILCNAKSTDQSPLEYVDEIPAEAGGRIPWRSYEKVRAADGESVKVPSGKLCLICFNVYRALGA